MAKAENKQQYAQEWKNHVAEILYGPCSAVHANEELDQRIRESVTKLCGEIDEVAQILEDEGVFHGKSKE